MNRTIHSRASIVRLALLSGVALAAVSQPAQARAAKYRFDIPAQAASSSLQTFARQSGKHVLFPYDATLGRVSPRISGTYEDRYVLGRLANAAGLVVSSNDGNTITLKARARAAGVIPIAYSASVATQAETPPPQARGDGSDPLALEEVVITAQRREENVQKASLSIEAVGEKALAERGVSDPGSLNGVVPGLKLSFGGSHVQTFIRGVGDPTGNAFSQASVSLNIDGVYIARSTTFGAIFYDVARVEVLRGPQGTLYGRNASGGTINVITNPPVLNDYSGSLVAEAGNYDLTRFIGVANIPLGDTLAARVAVQSVDRDGYLSDGSSDDHSKAARLRVLWRPRDDFSVIFIGENVRTDAVGQGRVYRPVLFNDEFVGTQDPRINSTAFPTIGKRAANKLDVSSQSYTAEINWDLGPANLTVIPSFRHTKVAADGAGDFLSRAQDTSNQSSLEARLGGSTERLKWVVGAYNFKEDLDALFLADQRIGSTLSGPIQAYRYPNLQSKAWAVFGETTASLTDRFRLIGGLRYTDDQRTRDGLNTQVTYVLGVPTATVLVPLTSDTKANAVTWKAGAEFDVTEQNMLFFTASKGFKSGGPDGASPDVYKPEFLTAYTLGSKNRFFNNTLQANLEVFYWQFKDQQTAFLGVDSLGRINFITRNAGQATISGADLDVSWRVTANDTLDGGIEYLRSNYDSFRYNAFGSTPAGTLLADGCISRGPAIGAPGSFIEDCSGHRAPRSPEWSGNLRYTHSFNLSNGADLTLGAVVKFETSSFLVVNYSSPNFKQPSFQTFDMDLTYRAPDNRWSLQGYVRNIENEGVLLSAFNASLPPASGPIRSSAAAIAPPRTYGVRLQANF